MAGNAHIAAIVFVGDPVPLKQSIRLVVWFSRLQHDSLRYVPNHNRQLKTKFPGTLSLTRRFIRIYGLAMKLQFQLPSCWSFGFTDWNQPILKEKSHE